jgi:GNAT superfamily N-acetyltransferase
MDGVVREATAADAERVAALALQLGYALPAGTARERLAERPADRRIAVLEDGRRAVVGWVEVRSEESLVSGRRCRVTGLVVDEASRGRGHGRALLAWAERWAAQRGCAEIWLTSNVTRDGAHAFYERLGWTRRKTSHVYAKRPSESS